MKNLSLIAYGIWLGSGFGFAQTTIDASFNASQISTPPNFTTVRTIVVQPDGKILFGGTSDYGADLGNTGPSMGRLNADGSWDTQFQDHVGYTANTGFNGRPGAVEERTMAPNGRVDVQELLLLPDGKIVVVGDFSAFNNTPVVSIARLNADGTLDSFGGGTGFTDFFLPGFRDFGINAISRQTDGKMIIGGDFTATVDGFVMFGYIARIDENGFIDSQFSGRGSTSEIGFNAGVDDLEIQSDGDIIVAGRFSTFRNAPCGTLARLNPDYTLDPAFFAAQGTGFTGGQVSKIALQPDGKIVVAGTFTAFNGIAKAGIARLNSDGTMDETFDAGTGAVGNIFTIALQQDGKLIVGGNFTNFNGLARSGLTRLNPDGSVDTSFDPGAGIGGRPTDGAMGVYALSLQASGRILVGGNIGSYDGTNRNSIVRLIDLALPVNLLTFEAAAEGIQAVLNWSTSFETNSERFDVERSGDGKNWKTVGFVRALGESTALKDYAFIDDSPLKGNSLYRLKIVDIDQTFTYSRIKSVVFESASEISVYPNPTSETLNLKDVSVGNVQHVKLYNETGREIQPKMDKQAGSINVSSLPAGLYFIQILQNNGTPTTRKFVISR